MMTPDTLAWINAGSNVLGKALGAPTSTTSSASAYLDTSGWSISFGNGDASATGSTSNGAATWPYLLAALAAAVIWKWN